jgi:hypothetical protein
MNNSPRPHAVLDAEIAVGLVLHLDSDVLVAKGATHSCSEAMRVRGGHFFACVEHDPKTKRGKWVPFYSDGGTDRIEVSVGDRSGHGKWTEPTCHFFTGQWWDVPDSVVELAARAGRDASRQGGRNRLKTHATVLAALK